MSRPSNVQAIGLDTPLATEARASRPAAPKVLRPSGILRALSGSVLLWSLLADDGSPSSFIHRSSRRVAWAEESGAGRALIAGGFLLWIPASVAMAAYSTLRFGRGVARRTGKPLWRQACEQLALALGLGVPPFWYYVFDFHDDEKRSRAAEYLYRFETKVGIYEHLRRLYSSSETTEALRNKAEFARFCASHGLAAVPVLAVAQDGLIRRLDGGEGLLPHRDLFLKPISGSGGRGAAVWRHRGHGSYESGGEVLGEAALVERLRALSGDGSWVVRLWVSNHPDLTRLSPNALSTVRVLTCLDERGEPEVTHAVLRMARRPDAVVDNFHAGGIAAPVALPTGVLGSATDTGLARDSRFLDVHPQTGAPIRGAAVPHWHDVLDLARRAHAAFRDHVAIGWDIAVLDDGPALVEGNKSPDLDIIQRTHGEPIGNSRFGELLAFHLQLALEAESAVEPRAGRAASG